MPFDFKTFGTGETKVPEVTKQSEAAGSFDFSAFGKGETAAPATTAPKKDDKKVGVVQGIAQTVAKPFLRGAANVGALLEAGNPENYEKIQKEGLDFGYLGKARPIGSEYNDKGEKQGFGKRLTDTVATGAEAASYILPVGEAKVATTALQEGNLLSKIGSKTAVQAGKRLGAEGAASGALQMGGSEAQKSDATLGSVAGKTALGGVIGGATGFGLGAGGTALVNKFNKATAVVEKEVDDLVGAIVQGKKGDIPKAKRALTSFDTSNIKTYDDMAQAADTQIKTVANKLEQVLMTDTRSIKLKDIAMETKVGNQTIKHNYVDDALNHLDELYKKTNDPVALAKIQQLKARARQSGLTINEINKLAIEHGQEFGQKAFSKATGEPLTSVNAQAFENTRTGLKETARDRFKNKVYDEADAAMSDLINLRALSRDMSEAANKISQKSKNPTVKTRIAQALSHIADFEFGTAARKALNLTAAEGKGTLNAIELEKLLSKNLGKLRALAEQDLPEETILQALERIASENPPIIQIGTPKNSPKLKPKAAGLPVIDFGKPKLPKTPPKLKKK